MGTHPEGVLPLPIKVQSSSSVALSHSAASLETSEQPGFVEIPQNCI